MIFLTEMKFLLFSQEIYSFILYMTSFQIGYFPEAFSNFTASFQLLLYTKKKIKVLILFLSQLKSSTISPSSKNKVETVKSN